MPTALENVFYQNTTVKTLPGCSIEYNMNNMIDNISVVYTSSSYESLYTVVDGKNSYKKLFPIDSIVKPFRPVNSGIKYYLFLDNEHDAHPFGSLTKIDYSSTMPRVYYAGSQNLYKYWVSAINQNIDISVKYSQLANTVTQAYGTGSKVVYTTQQAHGFTTGQTVSITGLTTSAFNLSNAVISAVPSYNTFEVVNVATGSLANSTTAQATLSAATKPALTNKIVVRFEKYHILPSNCTITVVKSDGTSMTPVVVSSIPSSGEVVLHYHGGTPSWQTSISEPYNYATPLAIKSIRVQATNPGGDRVIGLIEVAAKWVKDITSEIVDLNIQKESSSSSENLLPIGKVTANNLDMNLIKYNESERQIVEYNRSSTLDSDLIYMVKNAELKPYFKVYHSNATTVSGDYDKVYQGNYFIDTWSISSYGETRLNALDGAKYTMEAIAPEKVFEGYSVISILRSVLDSIGFTNYNFNYVTQNDKVNDDSIPTILYWWTDGTKTVWEIIQELCFDTQMNAIFDDNGILQFYTRNYIYNNSRTVDWNFYYDEDGSNLPNIVDIDVKEVASANQVKVIWSVPTTSDVSGGATYLWSSPLYYLAAGSLLTKNVTATSPWIGGAIELEISDLTGYADVESSFSFNGYFLIDSEIIEYDAIMYQYESSITNTIVEEWVASDVDLAKIKSISTGAINFETSSSSFSSKIKPLPKYRIKKRGALGTIASSHSITSDGFSTGDWTAYGVSWDK